MPIRFRCLLIQNLVACTPPPACRCVIYRTLYLGCHSFMAFSLKCWCMLKVDCTTCLCIQATAVKSVYRFSDKWIWPIQMLCLAKIRADSQFNIWIGTALVWHSFLLQKTLCTIWMRMTQYPPNYDEVQTGSPTVPWIPSSPQFPGYMYLPMDMTSALSPRIAGTQRLGRIVPLPVADLRSCRELSRASV